MIHHGGLVCPPQFAVGPVVGCGGRGTNVVAFGCPEIGEIISDRPLRPRVSESLARETRVHLGHNRMEALWVARGWIVHDSIFVEFGVSVCNSARVHEFHSLDAENQ